MKNSLPGPKDSSSSRGNTTSKSKQPLKVENNAGKKLGHVLDPDSDLHDALQHDHSDSRTKSAIAFALQQSDEKIRWLQAGISKISDQVRVYFGIAHADIIRPDFFYAGCSQ
jgi:hypothetical protein